MEKLSTIDRIKLVVKSTIQMLLIVNVFLLFFEIDILLGFVDEPINWDYYKYIN
jgi:hypothetical protein